MNTTYLLIGAGAALYFLNKHQDATEPAPSVAVKKGLTITENEALGYIMANKLAYPALNYIPESVIMGTIAVESNFDPNAVAPAGERGLMQVIYPSTWNDAIRRGKLPADLDSYGPKDNILVGMTYLRLLRDQLQREGYLTGDDANDWALTDQAYNVGPGNFKTGKRNQPRLGKFLLAREKYQRAGLP
jgi:soluble lytic murein transglycosylase-like protein